MPKAAKVKRTSLPGHARAPKLKVIEEMEVDEPDTIVQELDEEVGEPAHEEVSKPDKKLTKSEKALAKREALLAKITSAQSPYSKSHQRRLKRASKPENNLITSLVEVDQVLTQVTEAPQPKPVQGPGKLTAKKRNQVLKQESSRLGMVMGNKEFMKDPFAAIRLHTLNTMARK